MDNSVQNEEALQLALMSDALIKARAIDSHEQLLVDVGAFQGPLDVLLIMARRQKVDLLKVSISDLVDQYLKFIKIAQDIRLELAADYLVMAAWLTYLKSALLLPQDNKQVQEVDAETLALRLQFQIARLDAFRSASQDLMRLPQKNKEFFLRGSYEAKSDSVKTYYKDTLYDLLVAYGEQKVRNNRKVYSVKRLKVMTIEEAIARLIPKIKDISDWTSLSKFLPMIEDKSPIVQRSAISGTFVACLELAKRGVILIKQDFVYGEINLKTKEHELVKTS